MEENIAIECATMSLSCSVLCQK